ncbi:MAG: hypothetical protein QM536_06920 [Chitinophagaceae bacterium]|nr:hypothetical protein [Chitinophagaceae bacterium]
MGKIKKVLYMLFFLLQVLNIYAQKSDVYYTYEDEIKILIQAKKYQEAEKKLRDMLQIQEVVSPDIIYYFSLVLYENEKYTNSRNFIKQYIAVTKKSGKFYNEILIIKAKVDKKLVNIDACKLCDDLGMRYISCPKCGGEREETEKCSICNGLGKEKCPVCQGQGVLIKKSLMDKDHYSTCNKCRGTGLSLCSKCKGKKELKKTCTECNGMGKKASDIVCDHKH